MAKESVPGCDWSITEDRDNNFVAVGIYEEIRDYGPRSVAELSLALQRPPEYVLRMIGRLQDAGLIRALRAREGPEDD